MLWAFAIACVYEKKKKEQVYDDEGLYLVWYMPDFLLKY